MNKASRHIFDLDKVASERWLPILTAHAEKLPMIKREIESLFTKMKIGAMTLYAVKGVMAIYKKLGWVSYLEEIELLANMINVTVEKMMLMQLMYEQNSMCTSIITRIDDRYVHYRTMDWDMPFLKEITIELDVIKNKKTIFTASTWLGYIGVLTAVSNNGYSLSVNYRRADGSLLGNIGKTLAGYWPVGYVLRHVLENGYSYDNAKNYLCTCLLISPCYITMCGTNDNEPLVITRDSDKTSMMYVAPYTIQTNIDQYEKEKSKDILYSFARRTMAGEIVKTNDNKWKDVDDMIEKFNKYPLVNEETVYICIMTPHTKEMLTYIPKEQKK